MNRRLLSPLVIGVLTVIVGVGVSPARQAPFTSDAQAKLKSMAANQNSLFWLYLDGSAWETSPVTLTEKSLARRAKVDPVHLLIDNRDYPIRSGVLNEIRSTGASVRHVSRWMRAVSIEANKAQIGQISLLSEVGSVDIVRVLHTVEPSEVKQVKPEDMQSRQLGVEDEFGYGFSFFQNYFINAITMHQLGFTGNGVMVAMFDSGFDIDHHAFDSISILATWDFINGDSTVTEMDCPSDIERNHQSYHGTLTLGVIAGHVPDTLIGIAPYADYILAKTEITCWGNETTIEEDNWIAAAEWADSIGADIINSSLGYTEFTDGGSYTFDDLDGNTARVTIAADIAASKNIMVVNSAGNDRLRPWGHISAPADGDSVLAVGAVTDGASLASFSSPGPTADGRIKPDITTLGVGLFTASHLWGYVAGTGTSFSSPLVAGGVALIMEAAPELSAAEIRDLIRQTGSRADNPDNDFGYGLFDAVAAANFIRLDVPGALTFDYRDTIQIDVATTGRESATPILGAFGLPTWTNFVDNGNGTGVLSLFPVDPASTSRLTVGLTADIGYLVDTAYLDLTIVGTAAQPVFVGPNPFDYETDIFIRSSLGSVRSVAVFTVVGELVWEKVNISFGSADDVYIVRWDGRNQSGRQTAPGVYILTVVTDKETTHTKLLKKR